MQPSNPELQVINSLCKNKDIGTAFSRDIDEMFGPYEDVWVFLKEYYSTYNSVPDMSLVTSKFDEVEQVETHAETAYYIDTLRESFLTTRMNELVMKYAENVEKIGGTAALEKMSTALTKLGKYTASLNDVDITDFDNALEDYDKIREQLQETGSAGIPFGFDFIDSVFPSGMTGGQLIYLFGFSGKFKSWIGLQTVINAWKKGITPLIFSLEMSPEQVRNRIYTLLGEGLFDLNEITRGEVDRQDFENFSNSVLAGKPKFRIISNQGKSDITPAVIQGYIDKYKPGIVLVDFQQLMSDNAKSEGMTVKMNNATNELKALAMSNNIPIVAISAVTDNEGKNRKEVPRIEMLAWSRSLEYAAEIAIAIHKHEDNDIVEAAIRKNRNGDLAVGYLEVDAARGKIKEVDGM